MEQIPDHGKRRYLPKKVVSNAWYIPVDYKVFSEQVAQLSLDEN